jgi:hypothetical protein
MSSGAARKTNKHKRGVMSSKTSLQFVTKNGTSATHFTKSLGVNIHLGSQAYSNVAQVSSALAYLGIDIVRDNLITSTQAQNSFDVLAAAGYRFDFGLTPAPNGTVDIANFVAALKSDNAHYPGSIAAIEGPNEVNNTMISLDGTTRSIAAAAVVQKELYTAVEAASSLSGIPVYNVTIGSTNASQFAQLGNLSAYTDYANEHAYVMSTTNISVGLDYLLSFGQGVAPGKPIVITETGYTTLPSVWYDGVSETVQAKYTLDTLMEAYRKGVSQTFLYELFDESNRPANSPQSHFGLFRADKSPKLAAIAIHNLTQILHDSGASANTATGTLTYALSNAPATSHDMVFAKSNGNKDLVLWAEPVLWNQSSHSAVPATPSTVTVNFANPEGLVKVYDPLLGSAARATYANTSSIQVTISDHPVVIEIGLGSSTLSGIPASTKAVLTSETIKHAAGPVDALEIKPHTAGALPRDPVVHSNHSQDVDGVQNQSDVAGHDASSSPRILTSATRTHADGSLAYTYNLAADGTKTTDQHDAAGVLQSDSVARADGSSQTKTFVNGTLTNDVVKYAAGSADLTESKVFTAGVLTNDTVVHADKSKDIYDTNVVGKSHVADHFHFDASGSPNLWDLTNADGSHSVRVSASGASPTSTARVVDNFTVADSGGANFVFKPNFGNDTITGFHAGNAAGHDTITIDDGAVSHYSHLAFHQVNNDTLLKLGANDSILFKNVAPSALTAADFHFVHHDWIVS